VSAAKETRETRFASKVVRGREIGWPLGPISVTNWELGRPKKLLVRVLRSAALNAIDWRTAA
jgi:hypothetical protein